MASMDQDDNSHKERHDSDDTMESQSHHHEEKSHLASAALSHSLPADSPDNPQNWPLYRRVLTSFQAWTFAFTVALGLTCFSAASKPFSKHFDLPMIPEKFIAGFSLYLFGIAFAPYWTPHVTERYGRSASYFVYLLLNALFNLGAGLSHTISGVLVCRFFAGFFGGPCLVLLEGTFADIWSAETTNTYYSFQGIASFWGAAFGPFVGGYLVNATGNWRWTQYFPVILAAAVLCFGISMPESYQREIPRRRRQPGTTRKEVIAAQEPALSGVTFAQMAKITVVDPVILFFTEFVVTLPAILMFLTWFLTFQWFISVPAALGPAPPKGPGYTIVGIGQAFLGAVAGSGLGALSNIGIEALTNMHLRKRTKVDPKAAFHAVEYRVIPAMFGTVFITVALFWVGNTVNPHFKPIVPITGTAFFIWGSSMITFSIVPYTFDLFSPAATLGAITCQAVGRILAAAILPFLILQDISSSLGPKWGLGLFGFITLILWPLPYVLFFFGGKAREKSKHNYM